MERTRTRAAIATGLETAQMATEGKGGAAPSHKFPHRGVKIFTYPKTVFIWPTFLAAVISALIMAFSGDATDDPQKRTVVLPSEEVKVENVDDDAIPAGAVVTDEKVADTDVVTGHTYRLGSPQHVAGLLFVTIFIINLLILSIDFPRFTILAVFLGIIALVFFLLWLNVFVAILPPIVALLEGLFPVANMQFYFLIATSIGINYIVIWVTRYLDYWVIMPNEILHNHGPFSDLERFPTFNLKFDKEIPDIFEFILAGAGRLTLHITNERRAIVLDNVLWIDSKENELKKLMSRMDVRVTTDQEAIEPE